MVTTSITYKPHCGRCGFPIDTSETEVTYQEIYELVSEMELSHKVGADIYPDKCAHCGTFFERVEITPPKKLPDMYIK
jgi:predicted Zn-ribbon and HTH transcriptional regulator